MNDFLSPSEILKQLKLKPTMVAADFGSGSGGWVFPLAKILEEGRVYAVDILKDVLANIQSRTRSEGYFNVQTLWSDIERYGKTPIPEKSLNACFMVNVMFQLKDRPSALKESMRLLTDGGIIVVVDWA